MRGDRHGVRSPLFSSHALVDTTALLAQPRKPLRHLSHSSAGFSPSPQAGGILATTELPILPTGHECHGHREAGQLWSLTMIFPFFPVRYFLIPFEWAWAREQAFPHAAKAHVLWA